ncbi:MAG: methylmalonyl Co-A mutase-associated GTPase MeaB [Dermatophilaceae bacterium]
MTPAADSAGLLAAARAGSPRALARLISLVESGNPLPALVHPEGAGAHVIGITGAPGVGKSTTTNALVAAFRADGRRVAVLAVDPSSPFTGGALLGDRIRMGDHATDPGVYIRSMAARGQLGGLAATTPAVIRVLDAVGFGVILVETVGVGQSEVDIAAGADTTLVLLAPGMGDGIQAAKAGILEIGDVLAVNKADRPGAHETIREVRSMLRLGARMPYAWRPPVLAVSAATGAGVADLVDALVAHRAHAASDGTLDARRQARARAEIEAIVLAQVRQRIGVQVSAAARSVVAGGSDPHTAAEEIVTAFG